MNTPADAFLPCLVSVPKQGSQVIWVAPVENYRGEIATGKCDITDLFSAPGKRIDRYTGGQFLNAYVEARFVRFSMEGQQCRELGPASRGSKPVQCFVYEQNLFYKDEEVNKPVEKPSQVEWKNVLLKDGKLTLVERAASEEVIDVSDTRKWDWVETDTLRYWVTTPEHMESFVVQIAIGNRIYLVYCSSLKEFAEVLKFVKELRLGS